MRGLEWDLTFDEAVDIFERQGGRCALTGLPLVPNGDFGAITASLDRVDNSRGYVRGNVQFVHKQVNMMRGELSMERFRELCRLVTEVVT